jgi:hypothetical protein
MARILCLLTTAIAAACGTAHDAPPVARDTSRTHATADSAARASASAAGSLAAAARGAASEPDTAKPHLEPGRSKHDSIAYASAVAFGRAMMAK